MTAEKSNPNRETGTDGATASLRGAARLLITFGIALLANALVGAVHLQNFLIGIVGANYFLWIVLLAVHLLERRRLAWWLTLLGSILLTATGLVNLTMHVLRFTAGLPVHRTIAVANFLYVLFLPLLVAKLLKKEVRAAVGVGPR
ncbi:MAG: hypothetical protein SFU56_06650 [Capsulimonadales bacterium]|nr:hypothetical protein [Capsulimonadales bacterium]